MPKYYAICLIVLLAAGLTTGCATTPASDDALQASEAATGEAAPASAEKPDPDAPPMLDIRAEIHRGGKLVSTPRIVTIHEREIGVSSSSNDANGEPEHQIELTLTPVLGDDGLVAFNGQFQGFVRGTLATEQDVALTTPLGGAVNIEMSLGDVDYMIVLTPVMHEEP